MSMTDMEFSIKCIYRDLDEMKSKIEKIEKKVVSVTDTSMDATELKRYLFQHGIPKSDLFDSPSQHCIVIEDTLVKAECIRHCVLGGNDVYFSPKGMIGIFYRQ